MRISKCLRLALNILLHSKLRSWLTIIGIVIGVAAVVAIVSIGEGLQQNVQSRLGGLGADLITVSPGGERAAGGFRGGFFGGGGGGGGQGAQSGGSGATSTSNAKNLTKNDIQALRSIEGLDSVQGLVSGRGETYYLSEKLSLSINGVDPLAYNAMTTAELESGRLLGPSDSNMVVVGSRIAKNTFKQPLALNRLLTIEGKGFKIVGILKESGAQGGDDNRIIMPIAAARDTLEDVGDEKFDSIILKAKSTDDVDAVMAEADKRLMISRHLTAKTKDYRVSSAKATQERLTGIAETLTMFLTAIAAVSLLVGAVGIANTMFTSVLEKTKEIGIMKAIGARNADIMFIFIFNAALVGMVGGLFGIALGASISYVIPQMGLSLGAPGAGGTMITIIRPELLAYSLLLAVMIGIIAGAIPAFRASRLKPVDALRYE